MSKHMFSKPFSTPVLLVLLRALALSVTLLLAADIISFNKARNRERVKQEAATRHPTPAPKAPLKPNETLPVNPNPARSQP